MKKLVAIFLITAFYSSSAVASLKYECWRYVSGSSEGMTNFTANSKAEAEKLAFKKFKKIGKKVDYVKCK